MKESMEHGAGTTPPEGEPKAKSFDEMMADVQAHTEPGKPPADLDEPAVQDILGSGTAEAVYRGEEAKMREEDEAPDEAALVDKVKELRTKRKITQKELSDKYGGRGEKVPGTPGFSWYDKSDDSMHVVQKDGNPKKIEVNGVYDFGQKGTRNWMKWKGKTGGWGKASREDIKAFQKIERALRGSSAARLEPDVTADDATTPVLGAAPAAGTLNATPGAAPAAAPAAPAAAPAAMPRTPDPIASPAVVIPPIPVITGAMPAGITSAQVEELNRQIAERNNAMAAEIASLNERLARHATTEASAAVIAERDALRTIHGVRDADASRVLQIAHEKFAPQAIPADATPEQRERIERSNALSAKTLRTLEKRRYELRVKAEKIPTDAGKGAVLDALRNHLALPWWKRFGSSAAITSVGALTGYGAMSALTTYAGLGTLSFLGALAGAPLLTGGAIVGGTFAHLYKRFHHQNAIGQGRSALLHKSPMTSAAVLSLIIGGGKLALWNSPQGTAIIGALSKKLSLLTHGAFDSILHMFSSAPRPRVPIGKGPTLRL